MQKPVFISSLVAASLLAIPASAQRFIECSAVLMATPAAAPNFGNLSIGTTDVAQLMSIPDPANPGKFLMMFTTTQTGGANYDIKSATWDGNMANPPVLDANADGLNVPGAIAGDDMFQGSMDRTGLIAVTDTPGTHPVGAGTIICAQRATTAAPFGNLLVVSGIPSGYIDPQLCTVNGQLSLLFVNGVDIGIADLTVTATTAAASNIRVAIKNIPGANTLHSPTPIVDAKGNAHHYVCSQGIAGSGSDSVYAQSTEQGDLEGGLIYDDGTDWLANPMVIAQTGTAIYADASGGYGDPLHHDFIASSGSRVDSSTGGNVELHTVTPYGGALNGSIVFHNFGTMAPAAGFGPGGLGLLAAGDLCLNTAFGISAGPIIGTDLLFSFPVAAGALPKGVVVDGQSILFDPATAAIRTSNNWTIEGY